MSIAGGTIEPFVRMTSVLSELLIATVNPSGTVGSVSETAFLAGVGIELIPAATSAALMLLSP
ncbi:hypothetical protein D3C71_2189490 [compost metagenome]